MLERARSSNSSGPSAPIPSLGAVEFVAKATERGAADEETMETIQRVAFDEGAEAPLLSRRFKDVAFPQSDDEREDKSRGNIVATARRLAALITAENAPVPRKLAIRVEETLGELLEALSN